MGSNGPPPPIRIPMEPVLSARTRSLMKAAALEMAEAERERLLAADRPTSWLAFGVWLCCVVCILVAVVGIVHVCRLLLDGWEFPASSGSVEVPYT